MNAHSSFLFVVTGEIERVLIERGGIRRPLMMYCLCKDLCCAASQAAFCAGSKALKQTDRVMVTGFPKCIEIDRLTVSVFSSI